jgi:hypothetical protein
MTASSAERRDGALVLCPLTGYKEEFVKETDIAPKNATNKTALQRGPLITHFAYTVTGAKYPERHKQNNDPAAWHLPARARSREAS